MAVVKKIVSVLTTTFLVLVILLSVFIFAGKFNGGKTTLFGNELLVVLSGSMSPTFDTGSIVAIRPVPFEEIQKGDIVTFKDKDDLTVTHRVIDFVENKGQKQLVTKGDANDGKDGNPVPADKVLGEVQYWVPLVGYLIEFVRSKVGMLLFLVVPGLYIIVSQIWKLMGMIKQQEANTNNQT
ncbi:MAG TPA: signal peptidase I [Candidatus Bathyarchaeia archaeon]|nr:signal peptidase I [Candidatus Bathyarchaeia archaeon]